MAEISESVVDVPQFDINSTAFLDAAASGTPDDVWTKVVVLTQHGSKVTVRTKNSLSRVINVDLLEHEILPANKNVVPDLTSLYFMHEAGILQNLQERSYQDEPYTFMANVLVAVNPLKVVKDYSEFLGASTAGSLVHPYAVAEQAYQEMCFRASQNSSSTSEDRINQSIVMSGESGAGKTESSKLVLRHILFRAGVEGGDLSGKLLESNEILESFGNSGTLRNHNSSRFGKFIKLLFSKQKNNKLVVERATITTYLLEKSRITVHGIGEYNYHVFYYLLKSAPEIIEKLALDKSVFLKESPNSTYLTGFSYLDPTEFNMEQQKKNKKAVDLAEDGFVGFEVAREKDSENLNKLFNAFQVFGLSVEMIDEIFKILGGILHLGNVFFADVFIKNENIAEEQTDHFKADFSPLEKAAELLGVDKEQLNSLLTTRNIKVGGDTNIVKLNSKSATIARDSLSRAIYSKLFDWILSILSKKLYVTDSGSSNTTEDYSNYPFIGILDIFGFEVFEKNTFEQLLINYANEVLQETFNKSIFISELELYKKEGLVTEEEVDVSANDEAGDGCIRLFQGLKKDEKKLIGTKQRMNLDEKLQSQGLLKVIDSETWELRSSDEKLNATFHRVFKNNNSFGRLHPIDRKENFVIKHYAGLVTYNIISFLQKNKDSTPQLMTEILSSAENQALTQIFTTTNSKAGGKSKGARKPKQVSVVSAFKKQIKGLIRTLEETRASFIRCIKPNASLYRGPSDTWFNRSYVTNQLRNLSIPQTVKVLANGFPTRLNYAALVEDFKHALPLEEIKKWQSNGEQSSSSTDKTFIEALFFAFEIKRDVYKLGFTKVFFKSGQIAKLDKVLNASKQWENEGQDGEGGNKGDIVNKFKGYYIRKKWRIAFAKVYAFTIFKRTLVDVRKRKELERLEQERLEKLRRLKIRRKWRVYIIAAHFSVWVVNLHKEVVDKREKEAARILEVQKQLEKERAELKRLQAEKEAILQKEKEEFLQKEREASLKKEEDERLQKEKEEALQQQKKESLIRREKEELQQNSPVEEAKEKKEEIVNPLQREKEPISLVEPLKKESVHEIDAMPLKNNSVQESVDDSENKMEETEENKEEDKEERDRLKAAEEEERRAELERQRLEKIAMLEKDNEEYIKKKQKEDEEWEARRLKKLAELESEHAAFVNKRKQELEARRKREKEREERQYQRKAATLAREEVKKKKVDFSTKKAKKKTKFDRGKSKFFNLESLDKKETYLDPFNRLSAGKKKTSAAEEVVLTEEEIATKAKEIVDDLRKQRDEENERMKKAMMKFSRGRGESFLTEFNAKVAKAKEKDEENYKRLIKVEVEKLRMKNMLLLVKQEQAQTQHTTMDPSSRRSMYLNRNSVASESNWELQESTPQKEIYVNTQTGLTRFKSLRNVKQVRKKSTGMENMKDNLRRRKKKNKNEKEEIRRMSAVRTAHKVAVQLVKNKNMMEPESEEEKEAEVDKQVEEILNDLARLNITLRKGSEEDGSPSASDSEFGFGMDESDPSVRGGRKSEETKKKVWSNMYQKAQKAAWFRDAESQAKNLLQAAFSKNNQGSSPLDEMEEPPFQKKKKNIFNFRRPKKRLLQATLGRKSVQQPSKGKRPVQLPQMEEQKRPKPNIKRRRSINRNGIITQRFVDVSNPVEASIEQFNQLERLGKEGTLSPEEVLHLKQDLAEKAHRSSVSTDFVTSSRRKRGSLVSMQKRGPRMRSSMASSHPANAAIVCKSCFQTNYSSNGSECKWCGSPITPVHRSSTFASKSITLQGASMSTKSNEEIHYDSLNWDITTEISGGTLRMRIIPEETKNILNEHTGKEMTFFTTLCVFLKSDDDISDKGDGELDSNFIEWRVLHVFSDFVKFNHELKIGKYKQYLSSRQRDLMSPLVPVKNANVISPANFDFFTKALQIWYSNVQQALKVEKVSKDFFKEAGIFWDLNVHLHLEDIGEYFLTDDDDSWVSWD